MSMLINDVVCDTYAYIDDGRTGETVLFNTDERTSNSIVVYLYADTKPFPVDQSMHAECCIAQPEINSETVLVTCQIGENGEIVLPLPDTLVVDGANLYCEINVYGLSYHVESSRYKSSSFRISVYQPVTIDDDE